LNASKSIVSKRESNERRVESETVNKLLRDISENLASRPITTMIHMSAPLGPTRCFRLIAIQEI
jgi:hypothetical protein